MRIVMQLRVPVIHHTLTLVRDAAGGQPGAVATVCPGVQPGELPAATGAAPPGPDLDADDAAGEADQDRSESRPPRQGRYVPDGRGGRAPGVCSRRSWCGSVGCERRRVP